MILMLFILQLLPRGAQGAGLAWFLLQTFFGIEKIILAITRNKCDTSWRDE
jgi:hypothetical protein